MPGSDWKDQAGNDGKRDRAEEAGFRERIARLTAEILVIDNGVAFNQPARIIELSPSGALVEVKCALEQGQKLGLVIRGLSSDLFDLFSLDACQEDVPATIRTQGKVTEAHDLTREQDLREAYIHFNGNIRIATR